MSKPLISIVTPCYNESDNIEELYRRVIEAILPLEKTYEFEIIVIDNHSTDDTVEKLRRMAAVDQRLKVIINTRNFGHIRSPYYGILQSRGEATVYLASDLQDPPELIAEFIRPWEMGFKLVMAVKPYSQGNPIVHSVRRMCYRGFEKISGVPIIRDSTGFGLYDKVVLDQLRKINDPYPFLRGLIAELGYPVKTIEFNQPRRLRGITKNNFYTLYDIAWLGLVGHSKLPIRMAALIGIIMGVLSVASAFILVILKLLFWKFIPIGIAPLAIGMFFLFGIQFIFISVIGEYIGTILMYLQQRPIVVESERINFDDKCKEE